MRYLHWFAIVGWLLSMFPVALAADSRIKTQMLDPVVLLERNCSGVIYTSEPKEGTYKPVITRALTAKHCIRGTSYISIDYRDATGRLISTKQVYFDVVRKSSHDVAIIELRDTETVYPTAKVADHMKVTQGDTVSVVGWPLGVHKLITSGEYQGMMPDPRNGRFGGVGDTSKDPRLFLVASAPITGGNSGGALFQKTSTGYEVIGITSMVVRGYPNFGFWVPLEDIHKALNYTPEPEVSTSELAKKLAERLECEERAGDDEDAKAKCSEPEGEATP